MADYVKLIKNAVGRLDPSGSRDSRLALYERAREAQLKQLLSISPALSENEIALEQVALEEAVCAVETEIVRLPQDISVPVVSDLLLAAENIGKPVSRVGARSTVIPTIRTTDRFSAIATGGEPLAMMVRGAATGKLTKYWRWRSFIIPN